MWKRLLSSFLAFCILTTSVAAAGGSSGVDDVVVTPGGTGETEATVSQSASTFSVTLPSVLPVYVDAEGEVFVASDVPITNESWGPIEIRSIKVTELGGWSLVDFDEDFSRKKVGKKEFGLALAGAPADADTGLVPLTGFSSVPGGGSFTFNYAAKVALQRSAITETMASVVFTVGWLMTDGEVTGYDIQSISDLDMYEDAFVLSQGDSASLNAVAVYSLETPTWSSSDSGIVSISDDGVMTAKSVGYAEITYTLGELSDTIGVWVPESFVIDSSNRSLVGYVDGVTETLTVPKYFEDNGLLQKVTGIADGAFENCTSLRTIVMSGSIIEIGRAFPGCPDVTIELEEDISLVTPIPVGTGDNVTIDLNGNTLTGPGNGPTIANEGNLTVEDSVGTGSVVGGTNSSTGEGQTAIENNGGNLVIEDATVVGGSGDTGSDGGSAVVNTNNGTVSNGGTVIGGSGGSAEFGNTSGGTGGSGIENVSGTADNSGTTTGGTGGKGTGSGTGGTGGSGIVGDVFTNTGAIEGGTGGSSVGGVGGVGGAGGAGVIGDVESNNSTITGGAGGNTETGTPGIGGSGVTGDVVINNGETGNGSSGSSTGSSTPVLPESNLPDWVKDALDQEDYDKISYDEDTNTVTVEDDVTLKDPLVVPEDEDVVLDLSGNTITGSDGAPAIENNGNLTVIDSVGTGSIVGGTDSVTGNGQPAVENNGGNLTVEDDVTIIGGTGVSGGDGGAGIVNSNDGSISNSGTVIGGSGGDIGSGSSSAGDGGAGIVNEGTGTVSNTGTVVGGTGGSNEGTGSGGSGGSGIEGDVTDISGTVIGGTGGSAIIGTGGTGGSGVSGDVGTNSGSIAGGTGGGSESGTAGSGGSGVDGSVESNLGNIDVGSDGEPSEPTITVLSAVPVQEGTVTYTGSVVSPTWSDYDPVALTISGVVTATNAGMYTAEFTPKAGYTWSDGSVDTKEVVWVVKKADGSVSLNPTSLTFDLSTSTVAKTVAVTRAGDGAVSATSDNTSVATVSVSGTTVTVTPVAIGTATITVSVAEGSNHTAASPITIEVTVTASLTSLSLSAATASLTIGETEILTVTYTPTNTTSSKAVTWTSSDETVATVSSAGKVTAVGAGTATITATVDSKTATCNVTVSKKTGSVTLSASSGSITYPSTGSFTVTGNTSGGTLSVRSSDETVVTASISGTTVTVTPKKPGSAEITVTSEETTGYKSASVTYDVTVLQGTGSIELSATSGSVGVGASKTFKVSGNTSGGSLSVKSSDSAVATVSIIGETVTVKGVGVGTATITVTSEETTCYKKATTTYAITVTKGASIATLSTDNLDFSSGAVSFTVENAGDGEISARSSDPSVVSVSVTGNTVTVIKVGVGLATVVVSVAEGTNYLASENMPCSITCRNEVSLTASVLSMLKATTGLSYTGVCDVPGYYVYSNLPYKLVSVSASAFANKTGITSVILPGTITSIAGANVFSGCTSLTSVIIPASITSIATGAFNGATALTDVYYTGTEEEWNEIAISSSGNAPLLNATIHFGYVGDVVASGYSGTYDARKHSISVTCVGGTVTYATSASGEYTTEKPTYTSVGTYTTYYKVVKSDGTVVEGSETVKITKGTATLYLASTYTLEYGTTGTLTLTSNMGSGTLTAVSSDTSKVTVSVDGMKIKLAPGSGRGDATITVTLDGTSNYTGTTATCIVTVKDGTLSVSASDWSGAYDGEAHGISVSCSDATITYATSSDGVYSSTKPTYTEIGTYTTYYKVEKEGYTTATGYRTVKIQSPLYVSTRSDQLSQIISFSYSLGLDEVATLYFMSQAGELITSGVTVTPSDSILSATVNGDGSFTLYWTGTPKYGASYYVTITGPVNTVELHVSYWDNAAGTTSS